jgi:hypothetical protein
MDYADQELEAGLGATAVNAAALEQHILREAQAVVQPAGDQQRQQLRAVRRELRAVRSALARLEAAAGAEDGEDEGDAPAPLVRGELQEAVMRQRLSGLEAEQAGLEAALRQAGAAPEAEAPAVPAAAAGADLGAAKGRGGKRQKVQFDLEEADLFDAAEAVAGRGAGASLVETERDRLIRLVRDAHSELCSVLGVGRKPQRVLPHETNQRWPVGAAPAGRTNAV